MRVVEIAPLENGAHKNQTGDLKTIRDGWAVIPEDMETESFPFGEVEAEEIGGVMTVTKWTPGTMPEPEPVEAVPTAQEDTDAMLVDHELRLTILELGI